MKVKTALIMAHLLMMCMVSCKKDTGEAAGKDKPASEYQQHQTITAITREVASILEKVYEDERAYNEVNAAVYSAYYADERVLLKDLLCPQESELYGQAAYTAFGQGKGWFRKKFCEIIEDGHYPLVRAMASLKLPPRGSAGATYMSADNSQVGDQSAVDDTAIGIGGGEISVAIYFPYSQNFVPTDAPGKALPEERATIMYTDRDADSAPGRQPSRCDEATGRLCYRNVTVDDALAERTPVHVVAVGAEKNVAPAATPKPAPVSRVYNGWSRLSAQMDKLISFTGNGGGSEIKIGRISGYLRTTDQQISGFSGDVVTVHFTRAEIRQKKWKRIFSIWDPNWNYQDIEQIYAVYEEDTEGTRTLSGSLSTTVTVQGKPSLGKVTGEVGFKVTVMTQDEVLTQRKLDRKSFLSDGLFDQGWGFVSDAGDFLPGGKDWPILDGGTNWSHTLPFRLY